MGHHAAAWLLSLSLLAACSDEPETSPAPDASVGKSAPTAPPSAPAPAAEPKARAPAEDRGAADRADTAGQMAPMPATVARATELKAKPFLDAKTRAPLSAGAAVTVLERTGGWYRVTVDGGEGWVRLLYVSTQAGARGVGTEELESAARIATGRQGGGNIANTTGVRGLTPEQLREAQPDAKALERLQAAGVGEAEARAYARAHGLARRDVPFLPEPE